MTVRNFQFEHDDLSQLERTRTWVEANRDLVNSWLEGTDLSV
jgi:hypothetical protein